MDKISTITLPNGNTYRLSDNDAQLIKDTVGFTGKNRAYSQTNNAVIAHIENGITYDVSWTGLATVTLKKNSASGATITSGSMSPLSFTADADYELYFGSSATVTNIMVKDSRITDPTYEPYHESVEEEIEQIYADNGVLGAKNLLPNNATSQTINGVTFTVNADKSVTVNGTATALISVILSALNNGIDYNILKGKRLRLTGTPTGGGESTYLISYYYKDGSMHWVNDTGNGVDISFSETAPSSANFSIVIKSGVTVSNLTFKPMLRLASDPDDTYQPYAMTNKELTEKVFEKRTLTSADDLNNVTETGIYGVTSAPLNSPESTSYYTLIVQKTSDSDIRQTIFKGGYIYHRYYGGSPISWKSWYKFTGTVVS